MSTVLKVSGVSYSYHTLSGETPALSNITFSVPEGEFLAIVGPSGCGKSTFLRCLNRMNDLVDGCRVEGKVILDGEDIYDKRVDTTLLRKKVGMVFQQPNPFPMSIYDNIAYGPRLHGIKNKKELDEIQFSSDRAARLEKERDKALEQARKAGEALSRVRKERAKALEARIQSELAQLDMPKVRFRVQFQPKAGTYGMDETGMDEVQFLMSANLGEALKPIQKVASGGELARIMLALKNVLAEGDQIGTLVFDEVDTGVSGRAAQKVAEKMAQVARGKQVLCVTHLPQIAAMADTHFSVQKGEREGRTYTRLERLDRSQRREELARLIGGASITPSLLESAEELLRQAEQQKQA